MSPLIWAILLLVLGLVLLILEMFLPSAGILTFLAATAVVAAIVTVFVYEGTTSGTLFLAAVAVILPAMAAFLIKWWPKTPIGRRILNLPPLDSAAAQGPEDEHPKKRMVGQRGRAKSEMLPSGAIEIAGRTYDAVSEGVPIERGQAVEVVQVQGNLIVVRPVDVAWDVPPQREDQPAPPIDAIVPDPFDDSLS